LQSQVNNIAEDGNGFIWLSSSRGVQRFDGRTFQQVFAATDSKGIPDDKNVSLFGLQNGNLLLCSQTYISEYDIHRNRFKTIFSRSTSVGGNIVVLSEEKENIWCWLPDKGIVSIDRTKLQQADNIPVSLSPHLQVGLIPVPVPAINESLLMLVNHNIYIAGKTSKKLDSLQPTALQQTFFAVTACGKDSALVATQRGIELLNCRTKQFELLCLYKTNPLSVNRLHPVQMMMNKNKTCLISEGKELFELDIQHRQYTAKLVNLQNQPFTDIGYITAIYSDQHYNIWLLTENSGIYKINYRVPGFRYFGDSKGRNNFVKAIIADKEDNRVLCGTFGGGLLVFDTAQQLLKQITQFPDAPQPATVCAFKKIAPHQYIVFLMDTWNAWLLNTESYTLKKMQVNTNAVASHIREKRLPDYHLTLHRLNDSSLLMQSSFHTYRLNWSLPARLTIIPVDTFELATISSYFDRQKRLWVGSYGKYYHCDKDGSTVKEFSLPERILVRCFYDNGDGKTWMGTEKGLYLLDANGEVLKIFHVADGLTDDNIYSIRNDRQQNTWFSHNKGISCRKIDGSFLHFSKKDGLQENEFNTNTSYETPDGELFFGGVNGISSFYPLSITSINETPATLLTGVQVGGKSWKDDTAYWDIQKIVLPYYDNTISFNLTAIGTRSPDQYNYQYQLLNHDATWVNAGNNPQVRYVLQPGRYVFRYYAGNSFEKDPAAIKEITIMIKPPFWKTWWFMAAAIVLLVICIILLTRYVSQLKLKKKIDELERKRMMDEERLRISREMHDDIGAGLTQITLISEAAKRNVADIKPMNQIADVSRQLVGSMSEIIWSMNPENNTAEQLLSYLREQLNKLLEYSDIQYSIDFPESIDTIFLNNAQRRNLLLVTKEIVHNAIKHSRAKNIFISCIAVGRQLRFIIRDDGIGFDPSSKTNGNGLRNIRRRIKELDGELQVESSAAGTVFSYSLEVGNA
jgi:signal transduction histidine kinase/ligand-binding sensor domain-containing protein